MEFKSKFALWQKMVLWKNINVIITSIRFAGDVQYKLEWISNGSPQSLWMTEEVLLKLQESSKTEGEK